MMSSLLTALSVLAAIVFTAMLVVLLAEALDATGGGDERLRFCLRMIAKAKASAERGDPVDVPGRRMCYSRSGCRV
jgi:hypothetical protein